MASVLDSLKNCTVIWDAPHPVFPLCFQDSACVWGPCGFLLLTSVFYLPIINFQYLTNPSPTSRLFVAKQVICLLLVAVALANLFKTAFEMSNHLNPPILSLISPIVQAVTFLVVMLSIHFERQKGFITSGVLFIFWTLFAVAGIIPFYSKVLEAVHEHPLVDEFRFITFFLHYALVLVQLILCCFTDSAPRMYGNFSNREMCPEVSASFISRITFFWINSLVRTGYKKSLKEEDVWALNPRDITSNTFHPFEKQWKKELQKCNWYNIQCEKRIAMKEAVIDQRTSHTNVRRTSTASSEHTPLLTGNSSSPARKASLKKAIPDPSLFATLTKVYGPTLLIAHLCKFVCDLLTFVGPMLQSLLIEYTETPDMPEWKGYLYAALFFITTVLTSVFFHQLFHIGMTLGMRVKAALIAAIYKKALTMSNEARKTSTVGEIVNLMSVDAQRMQDVVGYLWMVWSSPLQIVIAVYMLWNIMGPSVLAGLAVMILLIPINGVLASIQRKLQIQQMHLKDQRIKLMNEVLGGIKVLKLYAWELSFKDKVNEIRTKEMQTLKKYAYLGAVGTFTWTCAPFLVTLVTFATYVISGHDLTSKIAFVALTLFNILRFPMNMLPMMVTYLVTVTLASFATYVLLGNNLDADTAFVSLSLFNILRFPINMMPNMVSYMVTISSSAILAFLLSGRAVTASNLFVSLTLLHLMRIPVTPFLQSFSYIALASVSIKRIGRFLATGDIDLKNVLHNSRADAPITVENGNFAWGMGEDDLPILKDIDLQVKDNSLTAVVGAVGAGKSSLISAILGEMEKITGFVNVRGTTAYVPQQAWIQNASLRDNILFGKDFDAQKYSKVIEACALGPDLEILPGGDMTEIGEKGINLSGGQKQRVSLARAVYHDCDIYLLDDPLSAVDSHVGKHIFDHVVGPEGLLRKKTRILVTHGVHWLPKVDEVVVILNGKISEKGSYEELVSHDGAFAQFLKQYLLQEASDNDESEDEEIIATKRKMLERVDSVAASEVSAPVRSASAQSTDSASAKGLRKRHNTLRQTSLLGQKTVEEKDPDKNKDKERLVQDETSEVGRVSPKVYMAYCKALGVFMAIFLLLSFLVYQAASVASNIWLSAWTEDSYLKNESLSNTTQYGKRRDMYLGIYGALGIAQAFFVLLYAMVAAVSQVRAAAKLHEYMLHNILRSPMSFFDTTPIGRILNRFSRDIETVDNLLPQLIRSWLNTFFSVVSTIAVISYSTPVFLSVIIPLVIIYYFVQRFYIPTSRQLKRIESTTRSPIYVHFSETVTGASTIRAFDAQHRFINQSEDKVDHNLSFYFASIASNRWLGFRLEFIGALVVASAAIFAVVGKSTLSGGLVGLSISYALQVTSSLNWMVRMTSDLETNIVSVERINEYSETPPEADWYVQRSAPPISWPDEGKVAFEDYSTRYRPGMDLVLRGITANIAAGEKVGIVGRTGAGKSSLTMSLFRIIEAAGGSITIDGLNVSHLGLHQLRSKLTILPQDPVLFAGTLRMNLDPFDQYTDDKLWDSLKNAHLSEFIKSLANGLEYECGEGGQNLSVGQRQLVCLARTLLRKTKILILDEATAAVDLETDELIQRTIRQVFASCTVLTIAHRLNTIMDNDRVMVLDKGKIREFDAPGTLLQNKDSLFYKMAKDANLVS